MSIPLLYIYECPSIPVNVFLKPFQWLHWIPRTINDYVYYAKCEVALSPKPIRIYDETLYSFDKQKLFRGKMWPCIQATRNTIFRDVIYILDDTSSDGSTPNPAGNTWW